MLHRRPDKDSHLETILYEIDMLRHCSETLAAKKARQSDSLEALGEHNLVIEASLFTSGISSPSLRPCTP
jgi:hypothetical protein